MESLSLARRETHPLGLAEELCTLSYFQQTHLPVQLLCAHLQALQTLQGPEKPDIRSMWAGSQTRDLLRSFQPDLFHDVTFSHHGRLSWATTMSSYAPPREANTPCAPSPDAEALQPDFSQYSIYPFCRPSWYRSLPELPEDLEEPMHHSWLKPSLPLISSPFCATPAEQTHISHQHFATIDQADVESPGLRSWTPVKFARLKPEGIDIETLHTAASRGKAELWAWELWSLWQIKRQGSGDWRKTPLTSWSDHKMKE